MSDKTAHEDNEQSINLIHLCLDNEPHNPYWNARLGDALMRRQLYRDTELKERPMLDYGTWLIVFDDDESMIAWLENEAEESEMPLDDVLEVASVEYVLMAGVELGQLEKFEM
jgi:hypothetical protein